jgi:predicted metalloprotease with PDZ domain
MRLGWLFLLLIFPTLLPAQNPVRLRVDATDVTRRVVHVQLTMPARPGPMTVLYPEWIPGDHAPTGPVINQVGLHFSANGQAILWRRNAVNMFALEVTVPAGAASLDVAFDFLMPSENDDIPAGAGTTSELAVLNWNQLLVYPQGADPDQIEYQATLRFPGAWHYGTALPVQRAAAGEIEFQPASLATLIDSPVSMGSHYRVIDLGTVDGLPHFMDVAADSEHAAEASPETIGHYRNLVKEASALFGSHHYRQYHFLFTLSDHVTHFGLEHHESSDNRDAEGSLTDADGRVVAASLLSHEFVHSWNGKYRRPRGLLTNSQDGGYAAPMKGNLLWAYEGLTDYLGEALTARSGLWTAQEYRESLAEAAAEMDYRYGRRWRPLEDTALAAQILYTAPIDYQNLRRSTDFYPEGMLIWLEVDTTIQRLSHGTKSLDDFCRAFFGGPGGAPALRPYDFEDVVAALNAVQPYDWAGFFHRLVDETSTHAPLEGIEQAGWKVTYVGSRSDYWKAVEAEHKYVDLTYSIGMKVKEEDGIILDVRWDGPAQRAGVAPAVKLVAVNGRQFTPAVLREAVAETASGAKPIELLIRNGEYYETHRVEYSGGERYPHLTRIDGSEDLLGRIIAAQAR